MCENDTEMSTGENQIVVYQPKVRLHVQLKNESVRMNQSRLGELGESATCVIVVQVQVDCGGIVQRRLLSYPHRRKDGVRDYLWIFRLNHKVTSEGRECVKSLKLRRERSGWENVPQY